MVCTHLIFLLRIVCPLKCAKPFPGKESNVLLKKSKLNLCLAAAIFLVGVQVASYAQAAAPGRAVGAVKSISGNSIVLTSDSGDTINITVQDGARLLRITPGETDLKKATPLVLSDVQTGDRLLIRGTASADGKTIAAVSVIAVKKEDVAQRQQKDLQDWQRRGAGGLVKAVDAAANTVNISVAGIGTTKEVAIKASPATKIRRYSEGSVKFDDTKPSTLAEVKVGDQLRARGNKNADGTELTAEEIVFGSFRNVAGLITAVDPAKNTITINDLATKKPITVRISADSQMHKLPQMAATMIAMRLKGIPLPGAAGASGQGGAGGGGAAGNGAAGSGAAGGGERGARPAGEQRAQGQERGGAPAGAAQGGGGFGGARAGGGGGGDLQQMLNRMPAVQFAELQKGDAVMIVTTEGSASSDATAVNLVSGVEPILTASPAGMGAAASLLSPWNLGGGAGGDAGGGGPQ
jgi:hypothetical protein